MTPAALLGLVPAEVGALALFPEPPVERRGPRSYTHDGRCLECRPAGGIEVAVDVEALDAPAAPYLAARLGIDVPDFLALWTRLEVTAKLQRVPVAQLLHRVRREGRAPPAPWLRLRTVAADGLVVSAGWRRRPHRVWTPRSID